MSKTFSFSICFPFDAFLAGRLMQYKWNQAWNSSKVHTCRCIERKQKDALTFYLNLAKYRFKNMFRKAPGLLRWSSLQAFDVESMTQWSSRGRYVLCLVLLQPCADHSLSVALCRSAIVVKSKFLVAFLCCHVDRYPNWPSSVGLQSLCNRSFWWRFVLLRCFWIVLSM